MSIKREYRYFKWTLGDRPEYYRVLPNGKFQYRNDKTNGKWCFFNFYTWEGFLGRYDQDHAIREMSDAEAFIELL